MSTAETVEQKCAKFLVGGDTNVSAENETKLNPHVERRLSTIIRNRGLLDPVVERKAVSSRGGNYLGMLYEVEVRGRTAEGRVRLSLFVKTVIPDDKMTMLSIRDVYAREMYTYDKLSRMYGELQAAVDVPAAERYRFVTCYGVVREKGSEALILENMIECGFSTRDRMVCMSPKFAELSVTELAKFHALSYALKKFEPEYFERAIRPMKTPFRFDEDWRLFLLNISHNTLENFESTEVKRKIVKFVESMLKRMPLAYGTAGEKAVLCHGDYRPNNILLKEKDCEIVEVLPVDYQLVYLGNPLNDFIYLVFGASDRNFRKTHLESLKSLYRDTMDGFLKYFDIDLETLYPAEVFERDFKENLEYGLMVGINFLPIILAPENDVPDFGETNFSEIKIKNSDVFKERIQGLVDDFIEWGYL